ncbi:tyrosine-type recombinase/integrase [Nocardia sp. NPDC059177]|uniref:tyrosine-type recombinase/integrase n=1 Tax=Nocardia sp. NPDC059177 TaxID=3346759 RepID=UPI0036CEEDF2
MAERIDVPGAAHLVLVDGVAHLDPAAAVHEAMLEGWARQQRVRFLKADTINGRLRLVQRVVEFSNLYPWQWNYAELEAFIDSLRSGARPIAMSTGRGYLIELKLFLEYVTDARYGWTRICLDRFGEAPRQLLGEWNMVAHVSDYEGRPGRRPLTYDEVQALFDAADARVDTIRSRGRKGALAAMRDATALKTVYAYGLRRREAWGLDLADLRRNPKAPQFGGVGGLFVRWGKSSKGSPPKRRTVLTVPEMDWIVDELEHWMEEVRPVFAPGNHPALFVNERCGRLSKRAINNAFVQARVDAELPEELDLHSLRHSYVTHLIEFGYPERFVSEQVGHAYAATTAIYTGVSDEYRNRLLARAIRAQHAELWEE